MLHLQNGCPHGISANSASHMPHLQEADYLYEIISMILKLSQFHMFGRRQPGATVKKNYTTKKLFSFQLLYQVH